MLILNHTLQLKINVRTNSDTLGSPEKNDTLGQKNESAGREEGLWGQWSSLPRRNLVWVDEA